MSRRRLGAHQVVGHQGLAEGDGGRLEDAAAAPAGRIVFAGPHAGQRALHGRALAALQARHLAGVAVDLDDALRRGPRLDVQAVHVLGDERVELPPALQGNQGVVSGVGLGGEVGRIEAAPPGALADFSVGHVVLEGGHLLGLGVLGPHALRAAEVGDAGIGGDAGAGEGHRASAPRRSTARAPAMSASTGMGSRDMRRFCHMTAP